MEFFSSSDLLSSIYYQIAKVALVKAVVFTSEIVSGIMKKKIGNRFINLCILAVMVVGVIKAGEYYRKDEYKLDASLYKLSGISRNVSPLEVGKIWRQQAKTLHPDSGGSSQLFRLAQEATKILRDPMKRQNYDKFHVIDDSGFQSASLMIAAWEAVLGYLVWGVFILPFMGKTSFLDVRNQTTLFLFGMLFMEILNIVSRVPLALDPLNYVLPYISLKQRHQILRDVCPFLCGLFLIYLRVFTRTWLEDYREIVGHCYHTIKVIESLAFDTAKLQKEAQIAYQKDPSKKWISLVPERAELLKQRNYLVASFEYFCAKLGINIPDSSSKAQEELRLKSIKFSSFLLAENTSKSSNLANSSNPNLEASQKLMSDPDPEEQELTKAKDALEMEFAAFSEEEKHLMRRELLIESVVYSDDTDKETPERIQHKKEMEKRETSPKGFILGIASFLAFYYIVNWIENFQSLMSS